VATVLSRRQRRHLSEVLLNVLTILVVGFLIFPILWLYLTALKEEDRMFDDPYLIIPTTVTVDNFQRIWNSVGFQQAFVNSVVVAGVSAIVVTTVALAAAFSLSRFRYRFSGLFAGIILAVQMLPGIVLVVPLIAILRELKLTDSLVGLAIVYLLLGLPIAVWMLKGFLDDIPLDLDQAALVDGATQFQVLRQILFPLVAPGVIAVGAFAFLLSWGEYLFALSLITSTDQKTLPLALQAAFGQYSIDWGLLTAGGAIISLPPALLFIFFQRYLIGGLTSGGVKG
jgi:ABC-type glycerol-3-phosphate transport system permease component